ncbi:MAG: peptidyl-prolyl cis-trans isomerase [Gammaproteobacteria bacterium]|nr:peptidyl-prolyl cis-trans isomerase [Gammaproteobacteria bacterium]
MERPTVTPTLRTKLIQSPLFQFLALGFIAFIILRFVSPQGSGDEQSIVVDPATINNLAKQFSKTMLRQPSQQELDSLIEQHIKEEIFLREGLALGLDKDDPVIRKRIYSKVDFLLRAQLEAKQASDEDLLAILQANPGKYALGDRLGFDQVWLKADSDWQVALRQLQRGDTTLQSRSAMLPRRISDQTTEQIDRTFGTGFSEQLLKLPLNRWAGPVSSGYGQHLVYVRAHKPAPKPSLESSRQQLLNDWKARELEKINADALAALKDKYSIVIEATP